LNIQSILLISNRQATKQQEELTQIEKYQESLTLRLKKLKIKKASIPLEEVYKLSIEGIKCRQHSYTDRVSKLITRTIT